MVIVVVLLATFFVNVFQRPVDGGSEPEALLAWLIPAACLLALGAAVAIWNAFRLKDRSSKVWVGAYLVTILLVARIDSVVRLVR